MAAIRGPVTIITMHGTSIEEAIRSPDVVVEDHVVVHSVLPSCPCGLLVTAMGTGNGAGFHRLGFVTTDCIVH